MRIAFSAILFFLAAASFVCAAYAKKAFRPIGKAVSALLLALIALIAGNFLIIVPENRTVVTAAYYIFMIGMDLTVFLLLNFTLEYCSFGWPDRKIRMAVILLTGIDVIQMLLNPLRHHVFDLKPVSVAGYTFYQRIPHSGFIFHCIVLTGIFAAVLLLFFIRCRRSPRLYAERYAMIFFVLVLAGVWQVLSLFLKTPLKVTAAAFGCCGLVIYYYSLCCRPYRLIAGMLENIASETPEALFFFDTDNHCIWANKPGLELAGVRDEDLDQSLDHSFEKLSKLFGSFEEGSDTWSSQFISGSGSDVKSYALEKRMLQDDSGKVLGSFLRIRDNSDDQKVLQNEMYKATHDALTGVYNRAGYELLLTGIDKTSAVLFLFDADRLRDINESGGRETGDRVIVKIADVIRNAFRAEDYVCRIGGDEFVVFMRVPNEASEDLIGTKVKLINKKLADTSDRLPKISVSAGVAYGAAAESKQEWFTQADKALYVAKSSGRNGYTIYSPEKMMRGS